MGRIAVREIARADRAEWIRMRDALWPGSLADHEAETGRYFDAGEFPPVIFVAEADGRLVGFLELGERPYAPDCLSSPVAFIEGWYVDPEWRRQGAGRALIAAAEAWARAAGHAEIASDVELQNTGSQAAHAALGYREVERLVAFRKALG